MLPYDKFGPMKNIMWDAKAEGPLPERVAVSLCARI